jgi:hydrogenase maturation protein HypF
VAWDEDLPPVAATPLAERTILARQLERGLNVVPTSSVGRLFDAVSALAGVRQEINYEAQAAIELENLVRDHETDGYSFKLVHHASNETFYVSRLTFDVSRTTQIDPTPIIHAVVADVRAGVPAGVIAARFHNGLAMMVRDVCLRLREETGLDEVALSGGVFQNVTLLGRTVPLLEEAGFTVYLHRLVPPNDGGISLGQAVVGNFKYQISNGKSQVGSA